MSKSITNEFEIRLLGLDEAAEMLSLSVWTIRGWVQQGKVTTHKLGGRRLIPISEIERLIEESRVPARAVAA